MPTISLAGVVVLATDLTAPVLSSPSATTTGANTAVGSVSTDEGSGTLYYLASANATETAGTVVASGAAQAVVATGVQNVSLAGLSSGTAYYVHYVQVDPSGNVSNRVTSSQITTASGSETTIILSGVVVRPLAETIVSVSGSGAGETVTFTTGGLYDLTSGAPSAVSYAGIAMTSITVIDEDHFSAVMPLDGVAIDSENDFVATINGVETPTFPAVFGPAHGQFVTLSIPFAEFALDNWARDDELVGTDAEDLIAADQIDITLKSSGTTSTPAGYDVNIDDQGNIWLSDPAGSEGNLADEDEQLSVTLALISSADSYSRSEDMEVFLALNLPTGTLTLGTPVLTPTTASLPFNWTGVDADSFEYQIGSGTITAIAASPIALGTLTAATAYTYRVRAVNGTWPGAWVSGAFTTPAATDTTPDLVDFASQTGVPVNTAITSNAQTITAVSAGVDIPITDIVGGQIQVFNGTSWAAATSSDTVARLNYQIRMVLTSPATFDTPAEASALVGGQLVSFYVNTAADDVRPVVYISGPNPLPWPLGTPFVAPTVTATDNEDGSVPVTSSGTVNHTSAGQYPITFRAYDLAGNEGSAVLLVNVVAADDSQFPAHRTVVWDGATTPALVIGDTFKHRITLNANGAAYNLIAASQIDCCVVSFDHSAQLNAVQTILPAADWATGIVTISMDTDSTAELAAPITAECFAWVEIQATIAGEKYTWFGAVRLVPGHIA